MADRTLTETEVDPRKIARGRPAELGVVVAHCRGEQPYAAAAVTATTTVGREPGADLVVHDPGVSRLHARLERRAGALVVSDLGSHNGTWVNGTPATEAGVPAAVGAVIRLAKTLLVVVRDVAPYAEERSIDPAGLVGGAALDEARDLIATFGPTTRPALILGDTGTGKEIVAQALHRASGRKGPLVALNCAAVPAQLVDAELFGHARGAFSNALGARDGLFRSADHGTLFLDELGELPLPAQAKLLRTLETGAIRAVGSDVEHRVDVRLVAATNRNLQEMVRAGQFREDLLHRVTGLSIPLPSLSERIEDVPSLVTHFLPDGCPVAALALEHLMLQPWPGNVRELRNVVLAAREIARKNQHAEIELGDVSSIATAPGQRALDAEDARLDARIKAALRETSGNVPLAAERLDMSRSAVYESMKRLGIEARSFRK